MHEVTIIYGYHYYFVRLNIEIYREFQMCLDSNMLILYFCHLKSETTYIYRIPKLALINGILDSILWGNTEYVVDRVYSKYIATDRYGKHFPDTLLKS